MPINVIDKFKRKDQVANGPVLPVADVEQVEGLNNVLIGKADLVGVTVNINQLPRASVAEVQQGFSSTTLVTPNSLKNGGVRYGADTLESDWNPNLNRLVSTGFALEETHPVGGKGRYFRVTQKAAPTTGAVTEPTNNDVLVSVSAAVGQAIGYLHLVTGPGVPANTRIVMVQTTGASASLFLSKKVTLATGAVLTFTPLFAGFTDFEVGDLLYDEAQVWYLRPGMVRVLAAAQGASMAFLSVSYNAPAGTSQFIYNSFTGLTFNSVGIDTANGWNAAGNYYEVPPGQAGLYETDMSVRVADGHPANRGFGFGIDKVLADSPRFNWRRTVGDETVTQPLRHGTTGQTAAYQLNVGERLYPFGYANQGLPISDIAVIIKRVR